MKKTMFVVVAVACAGAAFTGSADAAIQTAVTATGPYGNDVGVINDGIFPPDETPYDASSSVFYGDRRFANGSATTFNFDFGRAYAVTDVSGAVDFNDNYTFTFYDGALAVGSYTHAADSGPVTYGLQNFTASLAAPLIATSAVLSTTGGDALYGVGEAEFDGTAVVPSAVPEPASWVMMIGGVGFVGGMVRCNRRMTVSKVAFA